METNISVKKAEALFKKISKLKILVIGDMFLDRYNICSDPSISPEFPVLRSAVREQIDFPGGAGNVANSFVKLGARVVVSGFIGDNEAGKALDVIFKKNGISTKGVVYGGKTGSFMRIVGENNGLLAHLHRLDEPQVYPIGIKEKVYEFAKKNAQKFDLVFIADYAENEETIIDRELVKIIAKKAKHSAATSRSRAGIFRRLSWVFLNEKEAGDLLGKKVYKNKIAELKRRIGSRNIVLTRGGRGAITSGGVKIEPVVANVIDTCGAGDTFAATFCSAIPSGASEHEAGQLASRAAGIAAENRFTYCPTDKEILGAMRKANAESQAIDELVDKIKNYKELGKKIVFASGFFELIHSGHVLMLEKAKQLGDVLVVGINSDRSTRENRGVGHPFLPEKDRVKIISSLKFVDHVFVFDEMTPIKATMKLKPDIVVKGGDITPEQIIGRDIVGAYGGRTEVIKLSDSMKTENIINQIRQSKPFVPPHENS